MNSDQHLQDLMHASGCDDLDCLDEFEGGEERDILDMLKERREERMRDACEECGGTGQVPVSELAKILGTTRTHWVCLTCDGAGKAPQPELAEVLETLHVEQRDWTPMFQGRLAS